MILVVAPALVAVLVALLGAAPRRWAPPQLAARALSIVTACAAAAVGAALSLLAFVSLSGVGAVDDGIWGWCGTLAHHHRTIAPWVGAAATALLAAMAWRAVRALIRSRPLRAEVPDGSGIAILPTETPAAFATSGRAGQVVVSAGMLQALTQDEQAALIAHERSHVTNRHDRYVRLTEVAAAAIPLLGPLCTEMRNATERWADEDAAAVVGDRRTVARAVARAALAATAAPATALAIGDTNVRHRVDALLHGTKRRSLSLPASGAALVAVTLVAAATGLQLHHLAEVAEHACRASA